MRYYIYTYAFMLFTSVPRLSNSSLGIGYDLTLHPELTVNPAVPSLKRIAEDVGVSYTLVSKVLSGRLGTTGVSQETREAILKRAKELDYRPNRLAVALKRGRTGNVGVFIHPFGTPGTELSEQLLQGIADELSTHDYRMWLRFFIEEQDFLNACDDRLARQVDGLIVAGVQHPRLAERLLKVNETGCPVVASFVSRVMVPGLTNVNVDDEMQGYLAARHLLEQGCRRLVLFHTGTQPRFDGFLRAHQEMGVPVVKELIINERSFHQEKALLAIRKFLKKTKKFDGVATQGDSQALAVIYELLNQGISVPDDVLVTGIDDSPLARACYVPITSASSEIAVAGRKAAAALLERMEGAPSGQVVIQPRLSIRRSTQRDMKQA